MWATCCNWFCLDGQPEEAPPPQGARTQAYSNPGYSSFPSPTGSEPSCKACGAHFASMSRKVSGGHCGPRPLVTSADPSLGPAPAFASGSPDPCFHKSLIKQKQSIPA
uniref:Uncharacterized protein n=1 Tax=Sus scrofa TaxID=9823 RepID=A0A8D1V9M8_PIG